MPTAATLKSTHTPFNPTQQRKADARAASKAKLQAELKDNLSRIGKQWVSKKFSGAAKPTNGGISRASQMFNGINSLKNSYKSRNLRAGDHMDDIDQNNPDSQNYNNYNNGFTPPMQEMDVPPLKPGQEVYINEQNKLKVNDLITDIFAGSNPAEQHKKILEIAPFLKARARAQLGNIAENKPILGHGNRTWTELNESERKGLINDLKANWMPHSESLLEKETWEAMDVQQTAFFTNRMMTSNSMIATFMREIGQLIQKWTQVLTSGV